MKQLKGLVFRVDRTLPEIRHIPVVVSNRPCKGTRIPIFRDILGPGDVHDRAGWGIDHNGCKKAVIIAWSYRSENNKAIEPLCPGFQFNADVVVMQIGVKGEVIGLKGDENKRLALSALRKWVFFELPCVYTTADGNIDSCI